MNDPHDLSLAFRGCALVRRDGSEVLRYAGGATGSKDGELVAPTTRFQLASVSKQCTSAAVLILVDRGELRLEDRLNSIVPGGPSTWDEITVHQLLCHTSGLPHWRDLPDLDLCSTSIPPSDLLGRFRRAEMLHQPGTTYSYSSPGYVLLAHVVELVSTTRYSTFLDRELFSPAGMLSTHSGNASGPGYAVPLEHGEPVETFDLDVVNMGAGDVWSTVDDQILWNAALRNGTLLSDRLTTAMQSPHAAVPDEVDGVDIHGYGYGLYLATILGRPVVFHTGDNAGFLALNLWFSDADTQVVLLMNDTQAFPFQETAMQLLGVALSS